LRKGLRQRVRLVAHEAGLTDLKSVPEQVEAFAMKQLRSA
jgi:type I restriction enzyme R subunit